MKHNKALLLLTALLLCGATLGWAAQVKGPAKATPAKAAKTKKMTGTVTSFTKTSLVLSQGTKRMKKETTFVLDPGTRQEGKLAVGAKATVEYRVENNKSIATSVKVQEAKPAAKTKTSKPKPY